MTSRAQICTGVSIGAFLFIDRVFKYLAFSFWAADARPVWWFGWRPFLNPGVAFGIPVPKILVISLTIIILLFVTHRIYFNFQFPVSNFFAYILIFLGAISNLFDRIVYNATIDYFQLLTGVFNLADFMIVAGFLILIWDSKKAGKNI